MTEPIAEHVWDENEDESILPTPPPPAEVDLNVLDDGRCKASSYRMRKPQHPTYEHHFGPGGFNRCIGSDGHVNRLHKDDWGNVFTIHPEDGSFKVVRREMPPGAARPEGAAEPVAMPPQAPS